MVERRPKEDDRKRPSRRAGRGCLDVPTGYGVEMPLPHTRGMSRHSPGLLPSPSCPLWQITTISASCCAESRGSPLAGFARAERKASSKRYTDFAAESFIFYDRRSACGVGDHELGHG